MTEPEMSVWEGCYSEGWGKTIVPEAYSHPAKMSRSLLERIILHGFERHYWEVGSIVADPFSGIGSTGIVGAYHNLRVVGVELEPKFHALALENLELHRRKLEALGCPLPVFICGDSRQFASLVGQCAAICTSPPYADSFDTPADKKFGRPFEAKFGKSDLSGRNYGQTPGQIGQLRAGELGAVVGGPLTRCARCGKMLLDTQGCVDETPKSNRSGSVDASPPSAALGIPSTRTAARSSEDTRCDIQKNTSVKSVSPISTSPTHFTMPSATPNGKVGQQHGADSLGEFNGALRLNGMDDAASSAEQQPSSASITSKTSGTRAENGITACPTSKSCVPFAICDCTAGKPGTSASHARSVAQSTIQAPAFPEPVHSLAKEDCARKHMPDGDGRKTVILCAACAVTLSRDGMDEADTAPQNVLPLAGNAGCENIIATTEKTYWSEMKIVYHQTWLALRPGGVLVCVVKGYIKAGKLVDLPSQTLELLTHLGFTPLERIRAMLVKEKRHKSLYGGEIVTRTERKSFFRRLAESKGSPRIDYEEVLIVRKP